MTWIRINSHKPAVRDRDEVLRHGDIHVHAEIRLVVADVLVRPPNACSDALACRIDEPLSEIVMCPLNSARPWRIDCLDGMAFVVDRDLIRHTGRQLFIERHPKDIAFAIEF